MCTTSIHSTKKKEKKAYPSTLILQYYRAVSYYSIHLTLFLRFISISKDRHTKMLFKITTISHWNQSPQS